MTQMWLLWWPKPTSTVYAAAAAAATTTDTGCNESSGKVPSSTSCSCTCLRRLMKKLKKQGRMIRANMASRNHASVQCRYDPMSYSLNFDTSGCGSLLDDEEYYHYCAFSSRFVANPRISPRLASIH